MNHTAEPGRIILQMRFMLANPFKMRFTIYIVKISQFMKWTFPGLGNIVVAYNRFRAIQYEEHQYRRPFNSNQELFE